MSALRALQSSQLSASPLLRLEGAASPTDPRSLPLFSSLPAPGKTDIENLLTRGEGKRAEARRQSGLALGQVALRPRPTRGSTDPQEWPGAGRAAACCDTAAATSLPHSPACLLIRITHDSHWHRQRGRETVVCNYKELQSAALWQHPGRARQTVCDGLCMPCHPNGRSPAAKMGLGSQRACMERGKVQL